MQPKYIVGSIIVVVFIAFAAMSFQTSLTPYVPFATAMESGKTVQVKGVTLAESARYDDIGKTFNFRLVDAAGDEMLIIYNGVKPSNFEQAKEVVAKGRYHQGNFEADELLVKCPSKYEAEGVEHPEGVKL